MKPEQNRPSLHELFNSLSLAELCNALTFKTKVVESRKSLEEIRTDYVDSLLRASYSRNWSKLNQSLTNLKSLPIPDNEKERIINTTDERGYTVVHHLLLDKSPVNLLYKCLKLGYQILKPATLEIDGKKIDNCSPLHFAAFSNQPDKIKALKNYHHPLLVLNSLDETPLITLLNYAKDPSLRTAKLLTDNSTKYSHTSTGLSTIEVCISRGLWSIAGYLTDQLRDNIKNNNHSPIPIEVIAKLVIDATIKSFPDKLSDSLLATLHTAEKFFGRPELSDYIPRQLNNLLTLKDWDRLALAINKITADEYSSFTSEGLRRWLISDSHFREEPLLTICTDRKAPVSLIKLLVDNGAPLSGIRNNASILNRTLRKKTTRVEVVNELLELGSDPNEIGNDGVSNFELALKNRRFDLMEALIEVGASIPEHLENKQYTSAIELTLKQVSFAEAIEDLLAVKKFIPPEHDKIILRLFNNNPEHAFLYANAFIGCNAINETLSGAAFTKLYPYLIYFYRQGTVQRLIDLIETTYDNNSNLHGWHPNEAEMFGLLNHPRDFERSPRTLNYLTSALSGITRFINHGITVNRSMVDRWAQLGTETFSFKLLKHDTQTIHEPIGNGQYIKHPSILERFGFERIKGFDSKSKFGSGFALEAGTKEMQFIGRSKNRFQPKNTNYSTETTLVPCRGCIWISNRDYGTAVIKNSSTLFGRDLLLHPGYWHTDPSDIRDIKDDIQMTIEDNFYHLLEPQLYERDLHLENFGFLIDQWLIFKDEYRRWKFDTSVNTAWITDEESQRNYLVGAFKSNGFKWIFDKLSYQVSNVADKASRGIKDNYLALAFVNPDFAPFITYPFYIGNEKHNYIEITPERLDAIQSILDNSWDEYDLIQSGILPFVQVGIANQAELMIIDPNDPESI